MNKLPFVFAATVVAALVVTGCANSRTSGPTDMGDGTYIIASYTKTLSPQRVKLLQMANEWCEDKGQKAEFDSIMVVDRRSGLAKAIEPKEAIPYRAGNIEVIFHCVKPEA